MVLGMWWLNPSDPGFTPLLKESDGLRSGKGLVQNAWPGGTPSLRRGGEVSESLEPALGATAMAGSGLGGLMVKQRERGWGMEKVSN